MLKQSSKFLCLENSIEYKDIDEESFHEDSLEEVKEEGTRNYVPHQPRSSKKQQQTRNHILIFKNPKENLD